MVDKKKKQTLLSTRGGEKAPEDVRLGPIYKNIHPP